ncbi:MAG: methyltransferase domain-containing protein [Anaerolineales bacterium]
MLRRFLRFFFWHLYHRLSWAYDLVAALVSMGQWQSWGRQALVHVRGPRVLEVGFGPGHLQVALQQQGWIAFGIDESPQMLKQAARRLKRHNLSLRLARGLAQSLPFGDASFDTVLSTFPSEYIVDTRTLAEAFRVLRPGGRLVVLPMIWPGGALRLLFRATGQATPVTAQLVEQMRAPVEAAGFEVAVEIEKTCGADLVFVLARKPAPL